MRHHKTGTLTLFIILLSGVFTVQAQVELQRISTTERPNGQGLVIRYHLTQLPDSFRVSQPGLNRIEMVLFSMELNTDHHIPVSSTPQLAEIELYNLLSGVGTDIYPAEGIYFIADTYPDINGRDVLLSLRYTERDALLSLIEGPEPDDTGLAEAVQDEEETEQTETIPGHAVSSPLRQWGLSIGIRAGISYSNVSKSDINATPRTGLVLGMDIGTDLPLQLPYGLKPGIETGLYYTERGFKSPDPSMLDGETFEFDYIEIPFLGKASYAINDRISPFLVIGPSINFMVNAELVEDDGNRIDLDDYTRAVDFSGIFGIGIDANAGNTTINLQLRNNFGFSNVFTSAPVEADTEEQETAPVRFRHNYVSVVLGFRF